MNQFITLTSTALPIRTENIDTDQIIPASFLKTTKRAGLGKYLFYNWRYDENGKAKQNHFNELIHQSHSILIAGNNFGCGSSREHAVWALADHGFQVIISSSFGDIFYNNCFKNGLLPVAVNEKELNQLLNLVEKKLSTNIIVDLKRQTVCYLDQKMNLTFHFPVDPFRKMCLLKGVDELGYILSHEDKIREFEQKHRLYMSA